MKNHKKILTMTLIVMGLLCAGPALQHAHADEAQQSHNVQATQVQTQIHTMKLGGYRGKLSATYHPYYSRHIANAYDVSQWQGNISQRQANHLKPEINFMVLRAQGGDYKDSEFNHNQTVMNRAHIPYGAYSYSYYTTPSHAAGEARELYDRAPRAKFYVNDIEQNSTGSQSALNRATQRWAYAMKARTRKPVVLYSGLYFMNSLSAKTLRAYDALWIAAYGPEPDPKYHYDLWQKSESTYSPALRQRVDADVFPYGSNKPLSFWTGTYHSHYFHHHYIKRIHPVINRGLIRRARTLRNTLYSDARVLHIYRGSAERYAFEVNLIQRQAYRFVKSYRRTYTNNVRNALYYFNKTLRIAKTRTHRGSIFDQIPPVYYRSPKLHHFYVIRKTGINLYNPRTGRRMRFLRHGALLTNTHYVFKRYHGNWITKLVGYYRGRKYLFTSRKNCVHW